MPLAPADPSTGDQSRPQVQPFHAWGVDEGLGVGPRGRQPRDSRAVQLQRQGGTGSAGRVPDPVVGSHGGVHQGEKVTQDLVLLQPFDGGDGVQHALAGGVDSLGRRVRVGVELGLEVPDQRPRHHRKRHQRVVQLLIGLRGAGLAQVSAIGPQDHHVAPSEAGAQDQAVQRIGLGVALPRRLGGGDQSRTVDGRIHPPPPGGAQAEIVEVQRPFTGDPAVDPMGHGLDDDQSEALEDGQETRQLNAPATVETEPEHPRRRVGIIGHRHHLGIGAGAGQLLQVS